MIDSDEVENKRGGHRKATDRDLLEGSTSRKNVWEHSRPFINNTHSAHAHHTDSIMHLSPLHRYIYEMCTILQGCIILILIFFCEVGSIW